jgi:hypothetical protein
LEFFATNASVKRTGDHQCGRRSHEIKNEYLDRSADAIECHGPCRQLDYRKVTTSELQKFFAEETLCQGKFPSNAILPPLRAALAISIDECGLCFHELWFWTMVSQLAACLGPPRWLAGGQPVVLRAK